MTICQSGDIECESITPASTEICDGADNDCDGSTDEDFIGDSGNSNVDFPNSHYGPTKASYPGTSSGSLSGRLLPAGDNDWFRIYASENLSDFCITDSQDEPIRATFNITVPSDVQFTACACWSSSSGNCNKSGTVCRSATGGISSNGSVNMSMNCGSTDSGYLDVHIYAASATSSCSTYTLSWSISE